VITRAELQLLRSLRDKKHREELGLYAVEGEKIVAELLAAGHPFEKIYGTGAWTGRKTHEIGEPEMERASHFPTPSTVLAVGRIRREALEPGELDRGLTLALDGVQDPGNVGTMLRIADWFGLDRVLLSPECADLHSQKVIRASMGSFARVRTIVTALGAALEGTRAPVIGCALEGRGGLSEDVRRRLAYSVTIPRRGGAESLNAAVAAAIVCDNLRRGAR
jgi:TrmH family RNA methyltransferase